MSLSPDEFRAHLELSAATAVGADGHDRHESRRPGAGEHRVQVPGELGEVQVGVGVDERRHRSIIAGHGVTVKRTRPMSWPEAVTTSTV